MVCGGITKDGMSKSKVDPCGAFSFIVKVNSVLCLLCGKWIHGRCAGMQRITPKLLKIIHEENIGEAVEQEEKLCDEVESVSEFRYFGDRVSANKG